MVPSSTVSDSSITDSNVASNLVTAELETVAQVPSVDSPGVALEASELLSSSEPASPPMAIPETLASYLDKASSDKPRMVTTAGGSNLLASKNSSPVMALFTEKNKTAESSSSEVSDKT